MSQYLLRPPRLVDDRAVDQRAQLAANRVGGGGTHLGHEHDGEVLGGRDPERRGGGAAPVVLARDTEPAEHGRVEHARKAEAEAHAGAAGLTGRGRAHLRQVAAPRQMVARHVGQGPRADDAPAVQRAAVGEHLAEAHVV